MAKFRIVTGRAGTGKSSYCIKQMAEYIKCRLGDIGAAPAFLIVPEQFAVNSEKRLMAEAGLQGLLIDEVLSFKRAACRVLGRLGGLKYELLSSSGKVMLLTQAIRNIESELSFYGGYASKPRGIEMILQVIDEFGRYGAAADKVKDIAEKVENDGLLKAKLNDLSLIYSEYRKLTEKKFYDSETLYRDFITELPSDEMFKHSHVWIDGFNGFTAQEFEIIQTLLTVCDELTISICADPNDDNLFRNSNETYKKLASLAEHEHYVMCDDSSIPPRFADNPALAHLEKNYGIYPYKVFSGKDNGISIYECQNRYYEVEEVATLIKSYVDGRGDKKYKYSDIVIATGDIDSYKNIISSVFTSRGIPYFVDEKRQISSHPLVRYIIDLLELISSDWSYTTVFSFLKTGLYNDKMRAVDILENEILAKGIKGKSGKKGWAKYTEECKELITQASADGTLYKSENEARVLAVKLFYEIEEFRENIKKSKTVSECCDEIINFLLKTEIFEKVSDISAKLKREGRLDSADEYARIWNIVTDVLNQADTFLGDKEIRGVNMKARYMADILSNGFAQYKAGFIPHSAECVQVGTPERSKSINPKVMILLGANEGVFPSTIKDHGLLNDSDRDVLKSNGIELSDDNKKRALYAEFVTYTVLSTPSEKLVVTYSLTATAGEAIRPSSVIRNICKMFPETERKEGRTGFSHKSDSDKNLQFKNYFETDTDLNPDIAKKVLGFKDDMAKISVSRLEDYTGCPYSYLLNNCFRLKAREEFGIDALNTGILQHAILEKSLAKINDEKIDISSLSHEDCYNLVDDIYDEALGEKSDLFTASETNAYIASHVKGIAQKEVTNVIDQLRLNHLKPVGFEIVYDTESAETDKENETSADDGSAKKIIMPPVEVLCEDGFKVLLHGKIDRLDAGLLRTEGMDESEATPAYFRVVDYKSSMPDVGLSDIVSGKNMQLMFYIAAVSEGLKTVKGYEDKKIIPAAALYYAFGNEAIKIKKRGDGDVDDTVYENLMNGLILNDETAMQALHGGVCKIDSNSIVVPKDGFEKLLDVTKKNIKESVNNMRCGCFPIKPFSDLSSCKYCDFKSVCRVDVTDPKNVKEVAIVSKEEFWNEADSEND